ncbi:MAG: DUF4266 domain-containing protein [Gammaproteobacteria bacterium]|nr:DUF4266 domain-containing protein [Gammaproteobacteria bacterium]
MSTKLTVALILITLFVTSGCTTVKPWERGTLSKKEMSWSPDPLAATLGEHIYFAKEAAAGGYGSAGGGCGCN